MKALLFFILIFSICFQALSLLGQDNKKEQSAEENARIKYSEDNKEKLTAGLFTPIVFYGKVVDQFGNPVPNAKIGKSTIA